MRCGATQSTTVLYSEPEEPGPGEREEPRLSRWPLRRRPTWRPNSGEARWPAKNTPLRDEAAAVAIKWVGHAQEVYHMKPT